jgi:hypothetical protein
MVTVAYTRMVTVETDANIALKAQFTHMAQLFANQAEIMALQAHSPSRVGEISQTFE